MLMRWSGSTSDRVKPASDLPRKPEGRNVGKGTDRQGISRSLNSAKPGVTMEL